MLEMREAGSFSICFFFVFCESLLFYYIETRRDSEYIKSLIVSVKLVLLYKFIIIFIKLGFMNNKNLIFAIFSCKTIFLFFTHPLSFIYLFLQIIN